MNSRRRNSDSPRGAFIVTSHGRGFSNVDTIYVGSWERKKNFIYDIYTIFLSIFLHFFFIIHPPVLAHSCFYSLSQLIFFHTSSWTTHYPTVHYTLYIYACGRWTDLDIDRQSWASRASEFFYLLALEQNVSSNSRKSDLLTGIDDSFYSFKSRIFSLLKNILILFFFPSLLSSPSTGVLDGWFRFVVVGSLVRVREENYKAEKRVKMEKKNEILTLDGFNSFRFVFSFHSIHLNNFAHFSEEFPSFITKSRLFIFSTFFISLNFQSSSKIHARVSESQNHINRLLNSIKICFRVFFYRKN